LNWAPEQHTGCWAQLAPWPPPLEYKISRASGNLTEKMPYITEMGVHPRPTTPVMPWMLPPRTAHKTLAILLEVASPTVLQHMTGPVNQSNKESGFIKVSGWILRTGVALGCLKLGGRSDEGGQESNFGEHIW